MRKDLRKDYELTIKRHDGGTVNLDGVLQIIREARKWKDEQFLSERPAADEPERDCAYWVNDGSDGNSPVLGVTIIGDNIGHGIQRDLSQKIATIATALKPTYEVITRTPASQAAAVR